MSRWVLVSLAGAAGTLLWVMATWPLPPEVETSEQPAADLDPEPAPDAGLPPPPPPIEPSPVSIVSAPPATSTVQPSAAAGESPETEADRIFSRENGPVEEYKAQFEREPRDSAATEAEQVLRGAFALKDSARPVFRAVLCRETICRIETRLSTETLGAYVAAMTRIVHSNFDAKLASERTSLAEAGEVSVTVYAKRPAPDP